MQSLKGYVKVIEESLQAVEEYKKNFSEISLAVEDYKKSYEELFKNVEQLQVRSLAKSLVSHLSMTECMHIHP